MSKSHGIHIKSAATAIFQNFYVVTAYLRILIKQWPFRSNLETTALTNPNGCKLVWPNANENREISETSFRILLILKLGKFYKKRGLAKKLTCSKLQDLLAISESKWYYLSDSDINCTSQLG